jgi:hypothetical protein
MNKSVKTVFRLFLGILSIIATAILIIFLFSEVIEIDNHQNLKWMPLLIWFLFSRSHKSKNKISIDFFSINCIDCFYTIETILFPFIPFNNTLLRIKHFCFPNRFK